MLDRLHSDARADTDELVTQLSASTQRDLERYVRLTEADGFVRAAEGRQALGDVASPGELAQLLNEGTVQTAALQLIDEALIEVDAGLCNRLIICMPPQEGKSERVSHYGVEWMLRRHPDRRYGIVSYGADIARQFSAAIRTDIGTFDGTDGTLDLGLRLSPTTRSVARFRLAYPYRGGVVAIGIGGGLSGRPIDVLVIDDPVKDVQAADSEYKSFLAWEWWMATARPRVGGRAVIIVTTRYSALDLAGRLLTKQSDDEAAGASLYDRWRVINIPAEADHDPSKGETDPLGRAPGEFMASARGRTTAEWETTKRATAPRLWQALFQGRPSSAVGNVFLRHWWPRFDSVLWSTQADHSMLLHDMDEVLLSWDCSFKNKSDSDFVAAGVWARRGAQLFLVDQVRQRMSFTETLQAFRAQCKRWPQATAKLIEDKANGTAVIDSLKAEIAGIIPVEPHGSKYARAVAVSPFVQAGNVFLPSRAVALFDVDAYIEELAQFDTGAHDDQVDQTSQALARMLLHLGEARLTSLSTPDGRVPSTKPAVMQHRRDVSLATSQSQLPPALQRLAKRSGAR